MGIVIDKRQGTVSLGELNSGDEFVCEGTTTNNYGIVLEPCDLKEPCSFDNTNENPTNNEMVPYFDLENNYIAWKSKKARVIQVSFTHEVYPL